ncbi:MAG: FKBP-type peptidyl-prolyl cis-trans isomerase [Bacteroidales bacterium]|nr:FKBP-type peptidyl-prolyl cis-trans isomerase [Bacteroidaceae bacterium]MBQ9883941.1 FKBP-type peptidyl-prolyl cis-trans isomerase [Bacteroidaceae bacterium]MDO4186299.1 FKBP-type peptidyl-prolyl cis-trans isomerase [Bacteroidales bacterium]
MKPLRYIIGLLSFVLVGTIISCSEVEEESVYDHWQAYNEDYCDSLLNAAGSHLFSTPDDTARVDAMPIGQLFGIQTRRSSTTYKHYVFCKKLTATEGAHPLYTDKVSAYYCGSYLTGDVFDSNFSGYVATDTNLEGHSKLPQVYDTPSTFTIKPTVTSTGTSGLVEGWIAALQYMREGERWMLYVPYQSGYGAKPDATRITVPGYSTLIFDIILSEIVD